MADNNPFKGLPDVTDTAEEFITLSTKPMKLFAKKTINAYTQAALAAAVAVPLLASGGVPTISNIQARQPDENLPSQSQDTNSASEVKAIEGSTGPTTVSASFTINYEALAQVSRKFSFTV